MRLQTYARLSHRMYAMRVTSVNASEKSTKDLQHGYMPTHMPMHADTHA